MRLLYLDECQFHTHPHLAKGWQRRGMPRRIPAAGTDRRVTYFGALEYRSGIMTTMSAPTGDARQFHAFLDQLAARWPDDHLLLVLDNASYHKTADLRAWFADHAERISVQWLPTYSPQLNLIERVWGYAKGKLACHRLWNDLDQLCAAAQTIFDGTRATFAAPKYPHIIWRQDLCEAA